MVFIFSFPMLVDAYSVGAIYPDIKVCSNDDCTNAENGKYATVRGYDGDLTLTINQPINAYLTGGVVANKSFNLNKNESVTIKVGDVTGSWVVTGGYSDTPPADNVWYNLVAPRSSANFSNYHVQLKASYPQPYNTPTFTSSDSNVISCSTAGNDSNCTAVNPGTATITVSFPNININPLGFGNRDINPNNKTGYGIVSFDTQYKDNGVWKKTTQSDMFKRYKLSSFTYSVTVLAPAVVTAGGNGNTNNAQVTVCSGVDYIAQTSANVKWSYSDAENNTQTAYNVQLATDSGFTYIVAQGEGTGAFNARNITGLTPNTTYYARVATKNDYNGWSGYSNCSGSFTTLQSNQPHVTTCNAATNLDITSARVNWTYSDPENKPQEYYEVDISTDSTFPSDKIKRFSGTGDYRNAYIYGLTQDTTYYVRISTYNTQDSWLVTTGFLGTPPCSSFKTTLPPPPPTTSCSISSTSDGSPVVNWTYSSAISQPQTQYKIEYSPYADFRSISLTQTQSAEEYTSKSVANKRSAVVYGLNINSTYYARVSVYDQGYAWSSASNCGVFTTKNLTKPTDFKAVCYVDSNSVLRAKLSWKLPAGYNTAGLKYYNRTKINTDNFDIVNSGDYWSGNITGLERDTNPLIPNDKYRWQITTFDMTSGYESAWVSGDFKCSNSTLDISKTGTGTGTISGNLGRYVANIISEFPTATLTATPAPGSKLTLWSGCTSVSGNLCTIVMDKDKWTLAQFDLNTTPPPTTPPTTTPATTTTITIDKYPAITLNKGGQCKLTWKIENKPDGMVCRLTGGSATADLAYYSILNNGQYSETLQKNTKYTITCTKSGAPTLSSSVTCRVNPTAGEI